MHETEIRVRTDDGEMTTFTVRPDGEGPFPVAVLYMDGIGYREQIKENARRFAADGYFCVAPDLFYRAGDRLTFDMAKLAAEGFKGPEADRLMSIVASVTRGVCGRALGGGRRLGEALGSRAGRRFEPVRGL